MLYATMRDHRFCLGCPYGRWAGDRTFCVLTVGSCVKVPKTMTKPDVDAVDRFMRAEGYERIKDNEGRKL